jgi:2-polyprenyl-6-methoxyphenol hydroxylase-like FAD-dependent oxidoreductase
MRIACLGGGPAGLTFAISMKLRDPAVAGVIGLVEPAARVEVDATVVVLG